VSLRDCSCGKPVRLSASRVTVNRKRGVWHGIVHIGDSSMACDGPWDCVALKPYCKDETQREYAKLMRRWNEPLPAPPEPPK